MKRWIWVAVIAVVIGVLAFLANRKQEVRAAQPVTDGFTCAVAIDYGELSLKGQLSRMTDGRLLATFTEPSSLSGVAISWDGEEMAMELGGLCVPVNADNVPQSALVKSLLGVLTAELVDGEVGHDGVTYSGEIDGKTYTVTCDETTGFIRTLSVPQDGLEVTFSDVTVLEEEK